MSILTVDRLYIRDLRAEEGVIETITLTHAQITDLPASPVILINAAGTDKLLLLHWAHLTAEIVTSYSSVPTTGAIFLAYSSDIQISAKILNDSGLGRTDVSTLLSSGTRAALMPAFAETVESSNYGLVADVQTLSNLTNKDIELQCNMAVTSFAGGVSTNRFLVRVCYSLIDVG